VEAVTGQSVTINGAGRTDAGVHALGQVANFRIKHSLEPHRYKDALNFYLPDDIRVRQSGETAAEFHARYDATLRRYRYLVGLERSALYRDLRWEIEEAPSLDLLRKAAAIVLGQHDFSPFCVVSSRKENNECEIYHSTWRQIGRLLIYNIHGNRFLHSMVRSLVGAMLNVAGYRSDGHPGNLTLASFADIMQSSNEIRIPFTAPPHGLYLVSVRY
jgi:tRNA pseudouridine38-40 synthase